MFFKFLFNSILMISPDFATYLHNQNQFSTTDEKSSPAQEMHFHPSSFRFSFVLSHSSEKNTKNISLVCLHLFVFLKQVEDFTSVIFGHFPDLVLWTIILKMRVGNHFVWVILFNSSLCQIKNLLHFIYIYIYSICIFIIIFLCFCQFFIGFLKWSNMLFTKRFPEVIIHLSDKSHRQIFLYYLQIRNTSKNVRNGLKHIFAIHLIRCFNEIFRWNRYE